MRLIPNEKIKVSPYTIKAFLFIAGAVFLGGLSRDLLWTVVSLF